MFFIKSWSLDTLNQTIRQFNYTFTDKTDRPQIIGKGFSTKGSIGGNALENWCLIRLLPLRIGHCVPEGDDTWEILMLLKDIFSNWLWHQGTLKRHCISWNVK